MKKATVIMLAIALTLMAAGGAVLIGAYSYARANGVTPLRAAHSLADIYVGDSGVYVGFGPVMVDVNDEEDSVNVSIGPFGINVDNSGVTVNGRRYDGSRSGSLWRWGGWGAGKEPRAIFSA